jgi:hypothetical protein
MTDARTPLITAPGAYSGIPNRDYHRNPHLLPDFSLSASGAKTILSRSLYHFWADSPMNPNRPEDSDKPHFVEGRAAHDLLLLPDQWASLYHVTPAGFSRSATRRWAEEIEVVEHAERRGKSILSHSQHQKVLAMADAIGLQSVARNALSNGEAEVTIVWQDKETGVWLRCRPDWLPHPVIQGADVRVVTDLKFMAPEYCSPAGFSSAIDRFGYHLAAAFYFEGIKHAYGKEPTHWLHLVVEKEFPYSVSLYPLPAADIERGKHQMRMAVTRFAEALSADKWPSYADEPTEVGLPGWARKTIDQFGSRQDAALINATSGE